MKWPIIPIDGFNCASSMVACEILDLSGVSSCDRLQIDPERESVRNPMEEAAADRTVGVH